MVLAKVALTGASGMVGRHMISLLEEQGIAAVAASRTPPNILPPNFSWFPWDLSQWKSTGELDELFPDVQALFHFGGLIKGIGPCASAAERQAIFDVNTRSCLCLGEWSRQKGIPVVFLSSSMVYADIDRNGILEEDKKAVLRDDNFYGFSKWMGEQMFLHFAHQGMRLIVLRPSSIYGGGLGRNKMICRFLETAAKDEVIELIPPVEDRINLIDVRDVAFAAIQALRHDSWGTFNIAGPSMCSVRQIAETCLETVGRGRLRIRQEDSKEIPRERFGLSCKKAWQSFSYVPKIDLAHGIRSMWNEIRAGIVVRP